MPARQVQSPQYRTRVIVRSLILIASTFSSWCVEASCFSNLDPRVQEFEDLLRKSPTAVQNRLGSKLENDASLDSAYRAAAYALLAAAYSVEEKSAETHAAVEKGLALVDDKTSPVYLNLLFLDAARPLEEAEITQGIERAEAAIAAQVKDSPGESCALTTLGVLEYVANRADRASMHLTRAYQMSVGDERRQQRVLAAAALSVVMQALRNFPTALELSKEVIDWHAQRQSMAELSTAYFMHGYILNELGKALEARVALERSRTIGRALDGGFVTAYADLLICTIDIRLGNARTARSSCSSALAYFTTEEANEPHKQALTALAEIDLAEGSPALALAKLNQVLDAEGRDLPPFRLAQIYDLRARVNRALGKYEAALEDYEHFMQRFKTNTEDERAKEAATLRARFETDREIERNGFLNRELEIKNERLAAQTSRLRWMFVAAAACVAGLVLLTSLLMLNRNQKRLLARLAQEDELTGLANRRHTIERAQRALELARRRGKPLVIGILDLDHFKRINDKYGHAAGDFVLKEFARVGKEGVRDTDILGRWGGEEFLLVLSGTTLDVAAFGVIDRIRKAAARIKGPLLPDDFKLTLSSGIASAEGTDSLEEIIAKADEALYKAKNLGRNLVHVAQESYDVQPFEVRQSLKDGGIHLLTGKFVASTNKSLDQAIGS